MFVRTEAYYMTSPYCYLFVDYVETVYYIEYIKFQGK